MHSRFFASSFVASMALASVVSAAQPAVPATTLAFKKGTSSSTVQGKVQGPGADARDYIVRASAGQKMTVELQTKSTVAYFKATLIKSKAGTLPASRIA